MRLWRDDDPPADHSLSDDDLLVERLESRPRPDADGDQQDLADRQSLRRVAGLSTELADVTEVEYRQLRLERVVLVSVWTTGSDVDAENAMAELKRLAETAGSQVLEGLVQRRTRPDPVDLHRPGQGRRAAGRRDRDRRRHGDL